MIRNHISFRTRNDKSFQSKSQFTEDVRFLQIGRLPFSAKAFREKKKHVLPVDGAVFCKDGTQTLSVLFCFMCAKSIPDGGALIFENSPVLDG
ncbi:MAG: hypothetical protein DBY04_00120 [Clostridiales bacterium]|nr:MAG: hypothetical protein DBY04_00120 [Clostridiales bacterium]